MMNLGLVCDVWMAAVLWTSPTFLSGCRGGAPGAARSHLSNSDLSDLEDLGFPSGLMNQNRLMPSQYMETHTHRRGDASPGLFDLLKAAKHSAPWVMESITLARRIHGQRDAG